MKAYSEAELEHILTALDSGEYGAILRAKGIVAAADGGQWLHYDFVPEEHQVRRGADGVLPRLDLQAPRDRGALQADAQWLFEPARDADSGRRETATVVGLRTEFAF